MKDLAKTLGNWARRLSLVLAAVLAPSIFAADAPPAMSRANECAQRVAQALLATDELFLAKALFSPITDTHRAQAAQAVVGGLMEQLGGFSELTPLPQFPAGRTSKIELGVRPPAATLFYGYTFMAQAAKEGKVHVFLSVRADADACQLWNLAVHLPGDQIEHVTEIMRVVWRKVGLVGRPT